MSPTEPSPEEPVLAELAANDALNELPTMSDTQKDWQLAPTATPDADLVAQAQIDALEEARTAFFAEQQVKEQALEQRRLDLDKQTKLLVARLHELHDREHRLSEQLEEVLPERSSSPPVTPSGKLTGIPGNPGFEVETLRKQVREMRMNLEMVAAERDAGNAQLRVLRELQPAPSRVEASITQPLSGKEQRLEEEAEQLRLQIQEQRKEIELLGKERANTWTYLQELPLRLRQLEEVKAERDAFVEQLRKLTIEVENQSDTDDYVNLDAPRPELEILKQQLRNQRGELEKMQSERNDAWTYLHQLPEKHRAETENLKRERDAALAKLRELSQKPENWSQQEAEFASLRLQLKQEQRQLAEDARELHRRETELQKRAERANQEMTREQQRLEKLSADFTEHSTQTREERTQLDLKERELRLRDAQLHLREAEIREMREIAELDAARERAELNQERLKLARLREALRLERRSFRAELESHGRHPPSSTGSNF